MNVYQDAKGLVVDVYELLKSFPVEEKYALCDQVRRAVISITSNIAEGMNRMSDKEKAHFLGFAYASMMEVDSQLDISVNLGYITLEQYSLIEDKDRLHSMTYRVKRSYSQPLQSTPYALR